MPDFEKMYYTLFNAVSKSIDSINDANYGTARDILIEGQQQTEEIYLSSYETDLS